MSKTIKEKIIQSLIEVKQLKREAIDEALLLQKSKGISFEKAIIQKGLIKEEELLMLLVRELNVPFINLKNYKIDPALQELIPERVARLYGIVPLSMLEDTMTVAVSDPLNVLIIDDLKNITGKEVDIVMSTQSEIMKTIDNYYGGGLSSNMSELSKDVVTEEFEILTEQQEGENLDTVVDESEKAPIIRIVNLIIKESLKQRASDIHMEPLLDSMRVRYRVDGVLLDVLNIPKENQNAVLTRIKIMARLDITVNMVPQDGRFKLKFGQKEVDFRVSVLPTTFGQKVVMRILDRKNLSVGLDGLGISQKPLAAFKEAIRAPFGMVLVTGPTGSGKSTTLYSIMNELNTVDRNITTVEDPVEYLLDGLTQIQVKPEIGLTFAEGLRAILRQSPDIVMVGEIRDNETADIAIKASLTGQLVFATLHTNDAPGAVTRLIDMGVESFLVASSLVITSAQRLCRKICSQCKQPVEIPQKMLDDLNYKIKKDAVFYQGKGCDACRNKGYQGRMCVTEVLELDDDIRQMLIQGDSSDIIKRYAREKKNMITLWEDAMAKFINGETTLDEVLRVASPD